MSKNGILLFFLIVILAGLVAGLSQHLLKFKSDDSVAPRVLGQSIKIQDEVVFVSDRSGNNEIFSVDADNQNLKPLTSGSQGQNRTPALSSDKKSLAFFSQEGIYAVLYWLDLTTGEKKMVTATRKFPYFLAFSPSGKKLVYLEASNDQLKDSNLYLVDIFSGSVAEVAAQADFPLWSADSKEIIYVKNFGQELASREIAQRRLDSLGQLEPEEVLFKGGSWPIQDNEKRLIILNEAPPGLQLSYLDKASKTTEPLSSLAFPENEFYLSSLQLPPQGGLKLLLGFYSLAGSRGEVWLFDLVSWELRKVVNNGLNPLWFNDGQKIIFTRLKPGQKPVEELWQFDLSNSLEKKLTGHYFDAAPVNSFLGRSNTFVGQKISQNQPE